MRISIMAVSVIWSMVSSLAYGASVMTFESLAVPGTSYTFRSAPYTEAGFTVTPSPDTFFCVIQSQNLNLFMGSTGLSECNQNGVNTLSKVGGGAFALSSIDLAPFGRFLDPSSPYGGGAPVTFVGQKAAGGTVSVTFSAPPLLGAYPVNNFQTFHFTGFDDVVSVSWAHVYPYHQYDNITMATANQVCLLYDPAKAVKSGAAIPIRLQICDASGNNLSSSAITLHAISISPVSTTTSGPVQDSGKANADDNFRFDPTLGLSGGYVFNLKTRGLPTGTFNLNFQIGDDTTIYTAGFQVK